MKLFIEVDIENVDKNHIQEVIELLNVTFVDDFDEPQGWTAAELYNEENDTLPEIKGYNIYTSVEGKLINALTGNQYKGELNEENS